MIPHSSEKATSQLAVLTLDAVRAFKKVSLMNDEVLIDETPKRPSPLIDRHHRCKAP
jgi:hypothetical protein